MAKADQEMRTKVMKDPSMWGKVKAVDRSNTARLIEIVNAIGWPTISKVGIEVSECAWLLVQHATAELKFMKECLALMKQASDGDVSPSNVAFLEDRILIMEGKSQIYGTQFHDVGNGFAPYPIEDIERVDERRARVGLDTFSENEAQLMDASK